MLKEAIGTCDIDRIGPPAGREAVLDVTPPAKPRRPSKRRKADPKPTATEAATEQAPPAAGPPARPATERRHLAGADWLSGYVPRLHKAKAK